jgi:hypothetical protein
VISREGDSVLLQWLRDTAFRFFPLVQHPELGLALHPIDLATNKVLALVGRLEVRDWVDLIECSERLQPLAYLAWAACGKDPGFSPLAILEHAARTARYSNDEVASLEFAGDAPTAGELSRPRSKPANSSSTPAPSAAPFRSSCCEVSRARRALREAGQPQSRDSMEHILATVEVSEKNSFRYAPPERVAAPGRSAAPP